MPAVTKALRPRQASLAWNAPETGLTINANAASGSFNLDAVSPVNGLIAYACGFTQDQRFRNQEVPQGQNHSSWPDDLMGGWAHTFQVTNTSENQYPDNRAGFFGY